MNPQLLLDFDQRPAPKSAYEKLQAEFDALAAECLRLNMLPHGVPDPDGRLVREILTSLRGYEFLEGPAMATQLHDDWRARGTNQDPEGVFPPEGVEEQDLLARSYLGLTYVAFVRVLHCMEAWGLIDLERVSRGPGVTDNFWVTTKSKRARQ